MSESNTPINDKKCQDRIDENVWNFDSALCKEVRKEAVHIVSLLSKEDWSFILKGSHTTK